MTAKTENRILSIDFFRGAILFVLVSGITGVIEVLAESGKGGEIVSALKKQVSHGEWRELYFWDFIQPFFMFIVGVTMSYSTKKRLDRGEHWNNLLRHALIRSFWLLVLGFMLGAKEKAYYLTNILPQLAFTYPIAFLLMRKKIGWQLLISFAVIAISDLLYRYWPVEGYNQLIADHNFGAWVDLHLTGYLHPYHWVTFNAVPTLAHVIWGVVTGKILMSNWSNMKKFSTLSISGLAGLVIGYTLEPYLPIIERIATGTYVLVTGGGAMLAMAMSFLFVDMLNIRKVPKFFAIFGMNPIFLYLFAELGGDQLFYKMAVPFISRLFAWAGVTTVKVLVILTVAAMFWYLSYFLYRKKIFFKL